MYPDNQVIRRKIRNLFNNNNFIRFAGYLVQMYGYPATDPKSIRRVTDIYFGQGLSVQSSSLGRLAVLFANLQRVVSQLNSSRSFR